MGLTVTKRALPPHDCLPQRRKVAGREKQANDVTSKQNSWKTEISSSFRDCSAPTWRQRNPKATFLKAQRPQWTQTKAAIVPTRLRFTPVRSVNSLFICALIIPTHEAGRASQRVRELPDIPGPAKQTRARKKKVEKRPLMSLSDTQCCFGLAHYTSPWLDKSSRIANDSVGIIRVAFYHTLNTWHQPL